VLLGQLLILLANEVQGMALPPAGVQRSSWLLAELGAMRCSQLSVCHACSSLSLCLELLIIPCEEVRVQPEQALKPLQPPASNSIRNSSTPLSYRQQAHAHADCSLMLAALI
jgi:hypothetical protein